MNDNLNISPMKSIFKRYKYTIIGLGFLLFVQCQKKEEATIENQQIVDENLVTLTDAQLRNAPVETTTLSDKSISTTLKLNGKVDVPPQNLVSVSTPMGGYLKSTSLIPGMQVRKGQVIAIIENPEFVQLQQDYLLAKSKYHFAKLDYDRQKKLNQSQASSDKVTQQAQSEMNSQQITMNALAQQLQIININPSSINSGNIRKSVSIFSSINGFVSKVNVNIGKFVTPSDILFELINPNDIQLNLKVYEKDLQLLKAGMRVEGFTNNHPDKKYTGRVMLTGKDVATNGVAEVFCRFDKYEASLLPGMYMNAIIETETDIVNALPEESIVDFEAQSYVFVEEKKQTYRLTLAKLGESENGFVKILNADDFKNKKIVTKNAYTLLMKLKNTEEE